MPLIWWYFKAVVFTFRKKFENQWLTEFTMMNVHMYLSWRRNTLLTCFSSCNRKMLQRSQRYRLEVTISLVWVLWLCGSILEALQMFSRGCIWRNKKYTFMDISSKTIALKEKEKKLTCEMLRNTDKNRRSLQQVWFSSPYSLKHTQGVIPTFQNKLWKT